MASSTTNRWKLGLFVILGLSAALAVMGWVGASKFQRDSIESYAYFDEQVAGLEVGSPVKFRGVDIGKVRMIGTAPDRRHVEVVAEIYIDSLERLGFPREEMPRGPEDGPFVAEDLRVQLVTSFLTGVSYIESDFFDQEHYPIPTYPFEIPWNTVHSVPSTQRSLERVMEDMVKWLPRFQKDVRALISDVRQGMADMRLPELSDGAISAMASLERRVDSLDELDIVKNGTAALAEAELALAEFGALASDLRAREGPLHRLVDRYEQIGTELQEILGDAELAATTAEIRRFTQRTAGSIEDLALISGDARDGLRELQLALESMRRLSELLERDPGSLLHGRSSSPLPVPE